MYRTHRIGKISHRQNRLFYLHSITKVSTPSFSRPPPQATPANWCSDAKVSPREENCGPEDDHAERMKKIWVERKEGTSNSLLVPQNVRFGYSTSSRLAAFLNGNRGVLVLFHISQNSPVQLTSRVNRGGRRNRIREIQRSIRNEISTWSTCWLQYARQSEAANHRPRVAKRPSRCAPIDTR